jgi:hypothetical protein
LIFAQQCSHTPFPRYMDQLPPRSRQFRGALWWCGMPRSGTWGDGAASDGAFGD